MVAESSVMSRNSGWVGGGLWKISTESFTNLKLLSLEAQYLDKYGVEIAMAVPLPGSARWALMKAGGTIST